MSLLRPMLNAWLRHTEKVRLAHASDADALRRSFEAKARLYFRGPRGSTYAPVSLAGLPALCVSAPGISGDDGPLILYLHGGAYIFGSPRTHKAMLAALSERCGLATCLPDYRKAPEHPFPAAVRDAVEVYRELASHTPGIILGGDSAGGGLCLALLQEIKRLGLRAPMGCFCLSPLTDMGFTRPSVTRNAQADAILPRSMAPMMVEMVMQGQPPDHPLASPIHGDFHGAPPVWICVGDTEILEDDARDMAARLRDHGVEVTLRVERDLPHVWPLFHNYLPEARSTLDSIAAWISTLPRAQAGS